MTFQPTRPASYTGVKAPTPPNLWTRNRDPGAQDVDLYTIGDLWYNKATLVFWILDDFTGTSLGPQAVWIILAPASGSLGTLTGDDALPVSPVAGNINVLGGLNAIQFTNGGAGILDAAVQVDNVSIGINGAGQLRQIGSSSITWQKIAVNTLGAVSNGYMADAGIPISLTLPAVFALGDIIWVKDFQGGGITVLPNAGQSIVFNSFLALVSVSSISSSITPAVQLLGTTANSRWDVISCQGNWITT